MVTVAVENVTDRRIQFGGGSSTCQFSAVVRQGDERFFMVEGRICSCDVVAHVLDPGGKRTERWTWDGVVVVGGEYKQLPRGSYELIGVAGRFKGVPIPFQITD